MDACGAIGCKSDALTTTPPRYITPSLSHTPFDGRPCTPPQVPSPFVASLSGQTKTVHVLFNTISSHYVLLSQTGEWNEVEMSGLWSEST